ncbi:MAG: ABC transporter permease [candidate division Zixibacteria bacterium]|nr:ABC transporter permease [candidate division Zixibacteria bacterium]
MRTFLKLAWRNLFRNKRRTFIAGTAIGIGLAALIFVDALIIGMEENMIAAATSTFLGDGQVHRRGFRETYEVDQVINNLDEVLVGLERDSLVAHFSVRLLSFGMITSPANVNAVSVVGVEPSREKFLSSIDDHIIAGSYFEEVTEREIVIGSKLAEILEVALGDRLVLTVAQAGSGDLAQEMFRVAGIFYLNVDEIDRGLAFIRLPKARQMLGLPGGAHEIALRFINNKIGRDEGNPFWRKYSRDDNEAVSWTVILPQLKAALELSQFSVLIIGVILFLVVALGIINTLFMSFHERTFEFGVLRALGTRPPAMARLILFEAGSLAVVSIALGTLIGFVVTYIVTFTGIDYTGIEFAGVTYRELIYPIMQARQFLYYPGWVFIFTVVIGLYPAWYAARMSPVKAMRRTF